MSGKSTVRRSTIEKCECGEVIIGGTCPVCAEVLEELGSTQSNVYRELQEGERRAEEIVDQTEYSYRSVTSALSKLYKSGIVNRKRNPLDPVQNIYFIDGGERDEQ